MRFGKQLGATAVALFGLSMMVSTARADGCASCGGHGGYAGYCGDLDPWGCRGGNCHNHTRLWWINGLRDLGHLHHHRSYLGDSWTARYYGAGMPMPAIAAPGPVVAPTPTQTPTPVPTPVPSAPITLPTP